jgi:3-hydroxyacyl-[acyl-carrier-protein] dehydratase
MEPLDIRAIEAILPHRYPFLLVDRVDSITPDKLVARKLVSRNEPHFQGHYPGHPVMPGVLIVEALAQAGAIMACREVNFDPAKQVIYLLGVDKVRFRRAVVPGDVLTLEVTPLRKGSSLWKLRGEAKVGDEVAAEAELMAAIQTKPAAGSAAPPAAKG